MEDEKPHKEGFDKKGRSEKGLEGNGEPKKVCFV